MALVWCGQMMMSVTSESAGSGAYWFVGASYGGTDDQTSRFLAEGIWQNKFQEKNVDLVKSIKAGDQTHMALSTHLPTADGKMVYLRYCSIPTPKQAEIYDALGITSMPLKRTNMQM